MLQWHEVTFHKHRTAGYVRVTAQVGEWKGSSTETRTDNPFDFALDKRLRREAFKELLQILHDEEHGT